MLLGKCYTIFFPLPSGCMILKCAVKRQMIQIEEKKDFVIHLSPSTIDYRLSAIGRRTSAIGRRTFAIGHRLSEIGRRTSAYPYTPSNVHRPRLSSSACCPSSEFFSVFFLIHPYCFIQKCWPFIKPSTVYLSNQTEYLREKRLLLFKFDLQNA